MMQNPTSPFSGEPKATAPSSGSQSPRPNSSSTESLNGCLTSQDGALPDRLLKCAQLLDRRWRTPDPAPETRLPQRIGKFRIQGLLGQGGFGIVYLAVDQSLGRTVALKVPRLHTLLSESLLERFQREARAAAALDHENIIKVYEAGEQDGICYIASAFCPGPTLSQWRKQESNPVPWQTAARIVERLADAVAHSHERRVLHRDIKPGNIMLVPRSEGDGHAANGTYPLPFIPRLGDFGLAKFHETATEAGSPPPFADETATAAVLGTPAYMAPEQTGGARDQIGPATDIYALGAVLYELLTGLPPFQGQNAADVIDQVRHKDPVVPRAIRRDIPRDLQTVCLKCLEKDARRRYATAADLRDDLHRVLTSRPILARPPGWMGMTSRWVRRRPAAAALLACIALFSVTLTGLQIRHIRVLAQANLDLHDALQREQTESTRARQNAKYAREQEAIARKNEREALELTYATEMNSAWRARQAGDFPEFCHILDRYADGSKLASYRGPEWFYFEHLTQADGRILLEVDKPLYDISFPDDRTVAVVGADASVRMLDLETGQSNDEWQAGESEINSALFRPGSDSVWLACDDGSVCEWSTTTHHLNDCISAHCPNQAFKVVYSEPLNLLVTCGTEGTIRLFDAD